MAKKFLCLSRMGLCHDDQEASVSVKNKKKKNVNTNLLTPTLQFSMAPMSADDGTCLSRMLLCQDMSVKNRWYFVKMSKKFPCLSRM